MVDFFDQGLDADFLFLQSKNSLLNEITDILMAM